MTANDFPDFFRALWGEQFFPFPWQQELALHACDGEWRKYIAVPTGSGKTACIDIAVFALAVQAELPPHERTAPRRIFFIVNRRVIVDEAYRRAGAIAQKLSKVIDSSEPILQEVARRLRSVSGSQRPLDCVQLRGAVFRDNQWVRSLTQPTVIASTVDQVGSRLLFRGYGVSERACPIHAALVAHDSLLLLDEAHISRPFAETVCSVERYRAHSASTVCTPFHFVQMTATPPESATTESVLVLSDEDKVHRILGKRLTTTKWASLVLGTGVKKAKNPTEQLASILCDEAKKIIDEAEPGSIAVMVNRVATARKVSESLADAYPDAIVSLLIGRMRPLDRDKVTKEIEEDLKTQVDAAKSSASLKQRRIVVATQCLEVGADLDFDALVTECASLDALRQRFGRLNRGGRDTVVARAAIVMRDDLIEESEKKLLEADEKRRPLDPVYGNAMTRTWNWLQTIAIEEKVDFGIEAMNQTLKVTTTDKGLLQSPVHDAPILMPSHLDAWVQTSPRPMPDPDPAIFLHGPAAGQADVQICWRADLPPPSKDDHWKQTLSLCPPSSAECFTVPIFLLREWLFANEKVEDESGDVLMVESTSEQGPIGDDRDGQGSKTAFVWRGPRDRRSTFVTGMADVRPGDTIVIPVTGGGWSTLCHVPDAPQDPDLLPVEARPRVTGLRGMDLGDEAFRLKRRMAILRLVPEMFTTAGERNALKDLLEWATNPDSDWRVPDIRLAIANTALSEEISSELQRKLSDFDAGRFTVKRYPDNRGTILYGIPKIGGTHEDYDSSLEKDDDTEDKSFPGRPITLDDHTAHVSAELASALERLSLIGFQDVLRYAAEFHDWGKVDSRFQAMLRGGDRLAAHSQFEPLAKSASSALSWNEWKQLIEASGLPRGFRHEFLSVQLLEALNGSSPLPEDKLLRDLVLHLVASHHGHARPFAPVVDDDSPPSIRISPNSVITGEQRRAQPVHSLDSGISDRFWRLTRHLGWWGLAYLETALRIADQVASEKESQSE